MRIAYAGTLPPHPGGSAMVGADLVAGLARRGHAVTAIAPATAAALAVPEPLAGAAFSIRRYPVPAFESSPNHPASEAHRTAEREGLRRHLRPLLSAGEVDVVVAGRETFAPDVADLAATAGAPWIVLAQGATLWGMLEDAYPEALRRATLDAMGRAQRVVAVARHLEPHLRRLGLRRIDVVPNAVDTAAFAPGPPNERMRAALSLDGAGAVVMHVSNLKDLKRPLDVVHAAATALRRAPDLWFVVVGDGPGRALIEAESARLGVRERFRCTGWVSRAEVPLYLRLADVVVMPSAAEALALVYLETQACGRVLIASDIDGAREVVRDGDTGLLHPLGDPDALAECILRAAANPTLCAAIGARARSFAESYTLDAVLDAYERILTGVIDEAAAAPR